MSAGHLPSLLRRTGRLTLTAEVARAVFAAFALLVAAGITALVLDAVLGLHPWGLLTIDLLLVVLLSGTALYTARQAWRNRYNPRRLARLIEERLDVQDSRLINSVDLQDLADRSSSHELVRKSVQSGNDLAAQLSPVRAVDIRRLLRASVVALSALLGIWLIYMAAPRLFAMVVPRYLDPTGDHPPFTLLTFEVTTSPEKVFQGKPATISVKITGPQRPDQANLVFVGAGGGERLPMFRNEEGEFVLPIERAASSREYYIETPQGRSERQMLTVLPVPCFEKADVVYQFPKYTGWPSTGHELDSRGIRGLEKTEVVVSATATMPLREGKVELFPPDEIQPATLGTPTKVVSLEADARDVNRVSGHFTLGPNYHYRLTLIGVNGIESYETREGAIVSVPDQNPQVAILDPEPLVVAVEGWKVPITIQAVDDVGIERVMLYSGVNGWGPDPARLEIQTVQSNVARAHYEFDLAKLGARAGDIITYYASAYDNHPSGTHFADTPTYVIHVITLEEFTQAARQNYRMEQLEQEFETMRKRLDEVKNRRERLLEEMSQFQAKLERGEPLGDDELKKLAQDEALLKEFAEEAQVLAKELQKRAGQNPLYDFEKSYRETLERLSKQLQRQAASSDQLREQVARLRKDPKNESTRRGFRDSAQKMSNEKEPFDEPSQKQLENTEHDIEKMRLADELVSQGERLRTAILQQRELADRMAQFRDRKNLTQDDRGRIERLSKEQDLLRQEVDEAKAELSKAADAAKKSLPNMAGGAQQLCQAIDKLHVGEDQGQAARSARSGDGQAASDAAESAAKKLESLLSKCSTRKGGAQSGDLDGCFKLPRSGLEQSLEQLSQGRQLPGLGTKGGQGSGMAGSRTRMSVFGPHQVSQGESDAVRSGGRASQGRGGRGGVRTDKAAPGAESLNPVARQAPRSAAGNLHGVPVGYRDQAEAYFKRIAKEE